MTTADGMNAVEMRDRDEWRSWLSENSGTCDTVWLTFYKSHTNRPCIAYAEAVEEALCFGWIDGLIKRIDENRYARKFTPRRPDSRWSKTNKRRAEAMIRAGRMTDRGLALIKAARASGEWAMDRSRPPVDLDDLPEEFDAALRRNRKAARNFAALAPSYRKLYVRWIVAAKRSETRRRRVREAIDKLGRGEKLGLK